MKKSSTVILRASFAALLLGVGPGQAEEVTHRLKPSPNTVTWGYFDPRTPSVLRVRSGDTVEIETLVAGGPEALEAAGLPRDPMQPALFESEPEVKDPGIGHHILKEPVRIEGTQPGHRLEG